MQKIVHQAPIELRATPDEAPLIDVTTPAFAIGQHVEAVLDHGGEQLRALPRARHPHFLRHLPGRGHALGDDAHLLPGCPSRNGARSPITPPPPYPASSSSHPPFPQLP